MGLRDAFSGRIYHWNKLKVDASQVVYARLQQLSPDQYDLRDTLYAYYFGFLTALGQFLFEENSLGGRRYVAQIKSVTSSGLLNLAAAYTSKGIATALADAPAPQQLEAGLSLVKYACLLYGKDDTFFAEHEMAIRGRNLDASDHLLWRDASLILGLPSRNRRDMSAWLELSDVVCYYAVQHLRQTDWSETVSYELTLTPRIGGYPGSLLN